MAVNWNEGVMWHSGENGDVSCHGVTDEFEMLRWMGVSFGE